LALGSESRAFQGDAIYKGGYKPRPYWLLHTHSSDGRDAPADLHSQS
jgi:hypothetical protein